ncbi:MAG: 3-keto-5-aminohexanoate cleavage protein [Desulfobacterales bacterium]|nr:MAG: 3-keto-5-aminohexanoate cleavage protein [Desulfobacterales bacterium]
MAEKEYQGVYWADWVARQTKNLTMDKKLFITVCTTGATFSRKHNPNQPYSPQENAKEAIEAYQEGACMAHIHTRDKSGNPETTLERLKETIGSVFEKCPDMIIQPSAYEGLDPESPNYSYEGMQPMVDALHNISQKYMQSTIFVPISYSQDMFVSLATEENTVKTIEYLQANQIKPEFMGHNWEALVNVREWLIKPAILEKPYFISMGAGMHNAADTYPDPWGYHYLMGMINMMPQDTVVGASIGGRNWLPITVFAIMLGADFVRVGMEDHLWVYPHKDEKIRSCADMTRKISTIARELGRDIGTPDEARSLLKIK